MHDVQVNNSTRKYTFTTGNGCTKQFTNKGKQGQ